MSVSYLNAASHGLPDRAVLRRMIAHLDLEAMIGPVAAFGQVEEEIARVQSSAAALLNAVPEHVGFDSGTLSAWRAYVMSLPIAGKRLLVAPHEWGENIAVLRSVADLAGATVEPLPPLDLAAPDLSSWQERIDADVAAIFLPMVSSVAGLRYPVEAIGALARPAGAKLVVDAAQAIGQVEIDVTRLGCDALFATTRKWVRGPRQTALFWTADANRRAAIERLDTHVALRLGLGVALMQLNERSVLVTAAALRERSTQIRARAASLDLACLSCVETGTAAVSLAIPKDKASGIASALSAADIIEKWPNAAKDEPLSGLDQTKTSVLRLAPHLPTSAAEIETAFAVIADAL